MNSGLKADEFKIEKTDAEGEFPSNLVYKIYQDTKGFIWFGTMYGLYRYDGVNYISYRYNPFDSTSIGNDDVISIFEDSKGYLWFGTYLGGVSRYDSKNSSFIRFVHKENSNSICDNTVWSITEDKSGALWFGTQNGLSKFENNIFTTYRDFNGNKKSNHILSLVIDRENNLWIGSYMGGLFRFNAHRSSFDNFKRHQDKDSINGNVVRGLYCDKQGNLWAGMIQRGVCMIKAEDLKDGRYNFNKTLFDSAVVNAPGNATVYEISEDKSGNIFLSSSNNVYRYNQPQLKFSQIILSPTLKGASESVAMICDASNSLWVSLYENGLYKIFTGNDNFMNFSETIDKTTIGEVRAFTYYDNKIYIGGSAGLFEFNEADKKLSQVFLKSGNLNVTSLAIYDKGLIIGTSEGLFEILNSDEEKVILSNTLITKLALNGNELIAGTNNGLYFINLLTKDTISYRNVPGEKNSLSDNTILSLSIDNNNDIWIGTFGGLNKFNRDKKDFTRYQKILNDTNTLSNNYVFSMLPQDDNIIYVGTVGGLNVFNNKENKFSLIRNSNIRNAVVNSLLKNEDEIWMGTNTGLMRMDLKTEAIKNFSEGENIFNQGAVFRTSRGNILAGNKSGFIFFNPNDLNRNTVIPLLSFANIKIFNYKNDESRILDLSRLDEIELTYSQNNIQIDFALMNFSNPKKNQYDYMLEGVDENWISSGNKNYIFYANLNPGSYTLKVRGTNPDGVRSEEKSLLLMIHPPFWRTAWFYILAALTILALIFTFYKYRLRKNILLALEIEHAKEEEREKWREQASIDYHDELGHKLTRISMYSRRVLKKINGSANEIGNDVNSIIESSNSLRMSARDLIWSLNPSEDSLYDFITRVNLFADELFEASNIKYYKSENFFDWKDIELAMDVKRQMLFVIKEGMNNALKYSNAKSVKLFVSKENENLYIKISDDGNGFEYPSEYTGYGLLNMHKRAKKAGFDLEIVSSPGTGTKIIISNVEFSVHINKNN